MADYRYLLLVIEIEDTRHDVSGYYVYSLEHGWPSCRISIAILTDSMPLHSSNSLTNQDEVSQTIASALHALARDKASQDRLRRELLSFGSSSGGVEPTYDDYLNQMPFLDACVKETLRLWPALETGEREATKEDILPLSIPVRDPKSGKEINSVRIRAGQVSQGKPIAVTRLTPKPYVSQLIIVSHRAVNHSKDVWVDADEFKPQRWFEALPPSSKTTKGWNGLFTFLEGPRACIGIRLGLSYAILHTVPTVLTSSLYF